MPSSPAASRIAASTPSITAAIGTSRSVKPCGADEDLGADHGISMGAPKIGAGDVVEILLLHQHAAALVVEIEERLQVVEPVGGAQRLGHFPARAQAVAHGQLQQVLGLDAAFQVHVQLGLRQTADECVEIGHSDDQFVRLRGWRIGGADGGPQADGERTVDRQRLALLHASALQQRTHRVIAEPRPTMRQSALANRRGHASQGR